MHLTPQKCLKILSVFLRLPGILAFFVLVNTLKLLAPDFTFKMMKQKFEKTGTRETAEKLKSIEDIEYIISFACVKKRFLYALADVLKEAQEGCAAPNPELYDLNTRKVVSLLSKSRPGRPLVINFGSCSCPPFMDKLGQFGEITAKFSSLADFVTLYIREAHPTNDPDFTGKITGLVKIANHQNFEERVEAAEILLEYKKAEDNYEILVDLMDNKADSAYAAMPERLYVVLDGKIVYEGLLGPFDYRLEEVEQYLEIRSKLN